MAPLGIPEEVKWHPFEFPNGHLFRYFDGWLALVGGSGKRFKAGAACHPLGTKDMRYLHLWVSLKQLRDHVCNTTRMSGERGKMQSWQQRQT
jgi:hypothetical protein